MIDGDKAVTYLKSKIINLINNGSLNATYEESEHTISFYLFDIQNEKRPLLTLRLSNHHENFSNRNKKGRELPKGDDNLSIELYKPSKKQNRVRTNVRICYNVEKPNIEPFSVTVIEYYPQLMYGNDVNLIYQSILNWIKSKNTSAKYIDPLMNTSRRANIATKHADIHTYRYVTQAEKNFYLRYGMGDSVEPKYNIITENRQYKMKQRIRLTEGDLHRIIRKCVNEALEKPFRTAETVGPFVNNRAQFLNLRTKKEQMDSDWADLRHSGAYPYGDGPNQPDGWCPKGDYVESDDDRENGDYPSNPNILNRRFWESRQRKRNAGLTEAKLHKIIKKVLREDSGNYEYMEHYYAELFHRDGDIVDCEEFDMDNLKGAIKWAKAQAAAHPDLVSEVFYIDEHGDMEETGYYYGDWSV